MTRVPVSDLRYRDVTVNLRPSRAALLVCADENWAFDALRAVEVLSRTWGGEASALVAATPGWRIDEAIWSALAKFDADYWAFLSRDLQWMRMADESAVDSYLQAIVNATLPEGHDADDWFQVVADSDLLVGSWSSPAPSDELRARVAARTSPHGGQPLTAVPFRSDSEAPHPLVDLSAIVLPERSRVTVVTARDVPVQLELLLQSRLGSLSPSWRAELLGRGITIRELVAGEEQIQSLFELGWDGHGTLQPVETLTHVGDETVASQNEALSLESILQESPFALGRVGCSWYANAPLRPRLPIVVYCGTTATDFSRAHVARAIDQPCLWLPISGSSEDWIVDAALRALRRTVPSLVRHLSLGADCYFTTTSLPTDELENLVERFESLGAPLGTHEVDATWLFEARPIEAIPVERRLMLLDGERSVISSREPFIDDAMARTLEVQVPSQAVGISPDRCRWQLDVHTEGLAVPQRSCLNNLLSADEQPFGAPVRASHHSLTVGSHATGFVLAGTPQRLLLTRIRPRYPQSEEILRTLLQQSGGRLHISDKGNFSRHLYDRWRDLEGLATDARNDFVGRALSVWRDARSTASLPGKVAAGRRRMRHQDVESATGLGPDSTRELIDRWLEAEILTRGLVLRCPRCRNTDFHLLDEVGQRFTCSRCGSRARIEDGGWTGRDEAEFWYSMDELVVLALAQNCHVPLLVLSDLAQPKKPFAFAFESTVELSGISSEVDLLAIEDGQIIVGEATTKDDLGGTEVVTRRRMVRLKHIADALTADRVVLATTKPAWSNRVNRLAAEIWAGNGRLDIRVAVQELPSLS